MNIPTIAMNICRPTATMKQYTIVTAQYYHVLTPFKNSCSRIWLLLSSTICFPYLCITPYDASNCKITINTWFICIAEISIDFSSLLSNI